MIYIIDNLYNIDMTTSQTANNGINICTDSAYQNAISIKKQFQLFPNPPQRYDNLLNNPYILYPQYSQNDFNMRRKAEILKYTATKTNTKTNNLTRSERWAQLVNGSTQQPSQGFIKANTISQTSNSITIQTCPSGTILTTPSYASNIPGPVTQLYFDPNVPLYNYATGQVSSGILNTSINTLEFINSSELNKLDNKLTVNSGSILAATIFIQNPLSAYRDFTIQFPISIFIEGIVRSDISLNKQSYNSPITITFTDPVNVSLQYNGHNISNIKYDLSISGPKTTTFDISMVPNTNDPSNYYFSGNQYVGICTINNFKTMDINNIIQNGLTTQYGYVYDIVLNTIDSIGDQLYSVTGIDVINNNYYTYFNRPTYGIYVNVSQNTVNKTVNCSVKNKSNFPSVSTIQPLTVV